MRQSISAMVGAENKNKYVDLRIVVASVPDMQ